MCVDGAGGGQALLRIERGQATEEELAAVAVALFSLVRGRGGPRAGDGGRRPGVLWRPGRWAGLYRAPHSWR